MLGMKQKYQKSTHFLTRPVPVDLLHYHHDIMSNCRPDPRASWLQTPGDSPRQGQVIRTSTDTSVSLRVENDGIDYLKDNQIFELAALYCVRIGEMINHCGRVRTFLGLQMSGCHPPEVGNGYPAPNGCSPKSKPAQLPLEAFAVASPAGCVGIGPVGKKLFGGGMSPGHGSEPPNKKVAPPTAIKDTLIFSLLSSFRSSSFSSSSCL